MMKPQQFDKIARTAFGSVLHEAGFSCEKSRHCTFYREVENDIFHIVLPDLSTRGFWYDVKVFPFCALLDPRFTDRFPDDLGIPTDIFCYLAPSGIGPDQTQFSCKTEDNFINRFHSVVGPRLASSALPYLDRINSLRDMLPKIHTPVYKAIATHFVHGSVDAQPLLKQQHQRLVSLNSDDENVLATLQLIEELFSTPT